jgi:hypothetical protein
MEWLKGSCSAVFTAIVAGQIHVAMATAIVIITTSQKAT